MPRKSEKKWERRAMIFLIAALIAAVLGGFFSGSYGWPYRVCTIPALILVIAAVLGAIAPGVLGASRKIGELYGHDL